MKKLNLLCLLLVFFLWAPLLYAQEEALNNKILIEMKEAGLSEAIIKAKVNSQALNLDLSTKALTELKSKGFTDEFIAYLIEKESQKSAVDELSDSSQDMFFPFRTIEERDGSLCINNEYCLSENSEIQIYLPAVQQADFLYVEKKKGLLSGKVLGAVAEVAGSGAVAVGLGTNNIGTAITAMEVLRKAEAVSWAADALDKIEQLPISKQAKSIAGKKMKVLGWKNDGDGNYIVTAQYKKKKYLIDIVAALITGEVRLNKADL